MKLLPFCAALAAGEACGLICANFAPLWPFFVGLAVLVVLFGHGLAVRGWPLVAVLLLGCALALQAQVAREQLFRHRFWLREARSFERPGVAAELDAVATRLEPVRADFSRRLGLGLAHDRAAADLNRAILLGERQRLPRRTKRLFVEAGTLHVFAISGLHIMILAKVLFYLLILLCVPVRWVGLAAIPLLWGYTWMIGAPPSAVRATVMASFYFSAPFFWRRPNLLVSWELTFLTVHVVAPMKLFDVGNALSFAVMLAIALWCGYGPHIRNKVLSNLCFSAVAWSAGMPIAAHVFGRVTPGGLLANLVLIPVAGMSVVSGILGVLASFVSDSLAAHLNNAAALFTNAMVGVSAAVASLPGANFEVTRWSVAQCVAWYALILLVLYLVRSIHRRRHVF